MKNCCNRHGGKLICMWSLLFMILLVSTINGQQPEPPVLSKVRVDQETNDRVYIYWEPSPTPGVTGYIVYYWEYTGNNPFPSGIPCFSTPIAATEYVYPTTAINNHPMGFSVKAFIGNSESTDSRIDSTIHLSASYDSCAAVASLSWNDYNGWRGNILRYELIVMENGSAFRTIRLSPDQLSLEVNDLIAGNEYNFYVIARKNSVDPDDYTTSNGVTLGTNHRIYPEYIYANYGTVTGDDHPEVMFTIDPASELTYYSLWRSEDPSEFDERLTDLEVFDNRLVYTDTEVRADERPYYYQLRASNENCDNATVGISGNIAGTILLQARTEGQDVILDWTGYRDWPGGVMNYDIYRSGNSGDELLTSTAGTTLSYVDQTNGSNQEGQAEDDLLEAELCYRVVAQEAGNPPYGDAPASSTSNEVCVLLDPVVSFPFNAFEPGSITNDDFGPEMEYLPRGYSFKIFNRLGNLIFETNDPLERWNGKSGGNIVPEGVYRYQLIYLNDNNSKVVLQGSVTVVR